MFHLLPVICCLMIEVGSNLFFSCLGTSVLALYLVSKVFLDVNNCYCHFQSLRVKLL